MLNKAIFALRPQALRPALVHIPLAPYHERVIDHYENPRNVGSLDKASPNVGTGLVGAPACGDVMKLQIEVEEGGKIIKKAVFKVSSLS